MTEQIAIGIVLGGILGLAILGIILWVESIKEKKQLLKASKVKHEVCSYCGKLGHDKDMEIKIHLLENGNWKIDYYHQKCYLIKFGVEKCLCGKGWVEKKKVGRPKKEVK